MVEVQNQTLWPPLDLHLPCRHLLSVAAITLEFVDAEHPLLVCELFDAVVERSALLVHVHRECHEGLLACAPLLALEARGLRD